MHLALLLAVTLPARPMDDPTPLSTRIRGVTVYGDRALVLREGEAELKEGVTEIVVGRLPVGIADDSIRVKVGRGAMVVGVEVRTKTDREAISAAVEDLRRKKREIGKALDAARDELATLVAGREFVAALKAASAERISKGMVEGGLEPGKWGAGLEFVTTNLSANAKAQRDASYRVAGLEEELQALEGKLGAMQGGQIVPYKEAAVSIASGGAGTAPLEIEYLIAGAGWRPVYDLRAAEDFSGVGLSYRAAVRQQTGEDWSGVELVLSTARPQLGAAPPPLRPIRLSVPRPAPAETAASARRFRASGDAVAGTKLRVGMDKGEGEAEADAFLGSEVLAKSLAPATPAVAAVEERGISIQFRVPRAETVPADGQEHTVLVSEERLEGAPEHFASPKTAARVFLKARTKNTTAFPILAGQASVYFGPDFVGRAPLKDIRPGEEFDLYLGQDAGLTIERKKVKEYREGPGFLGNDQTIHYEWEVRVKNTRKERAKVSVKEAVPVSQDERVRVKVKTANPAPAGGEEAERERTRDGIYRFDLDMPAGGERVVALAYSISFPNDLPVVGLPE